MVASDARIAALAKLAAAASKLALATYLVEAEDSHPDGRSDE
jgi:hypothetical protein